MQSGVGLYQSTSSFYLLLLQGQSVERDLLAGGARAVHWPDVTKPKLRLCLRLHEAGWLWSGGFALDTPGDLFVKIRHRSACWSCSRICVLVSPENRPSTYECPCVYLYVLHDFKYDLSGETFRMHSIWFAVHICCLYLLGKAVQPSQG